MFGRSGKKIERIPEDTVVLKPLLGIRPGVYLAVLYALILSGILFAVLLVPGLRKPGSLVQFNSEPQGVAVRIQGAYAGSTPFSAFVASGDKNILFVSPGFQDLAIQKTIKSRFFASLFFPRKEEITVELSSAEPLRVLSLGASSFAAWSFTGEPSASYQVPRPLSEAAYRAGSYAKDEASRKDMEGILHAAARYASNSNAMRELLRSYLLIESSGQASSPLSLLGGARRALEYLSQQEGSAAWLASVTSKNAASTIAASSWYLSQNKTASLLLSSQEDPRPASSAPSLRLGNSTFLAVRAGKLVLSSSFPYSVEVPAFYIASEEVSSSQWSTFIQEQGEWALSNTSSLVKEGLATDSYLQGSEDPRYPKPSVPGVSWYAAAAYCRWLSNKLPAELSDYEVRLPRETEWEWAAKSTLGLEAMSGGLWEWCLDAYVPLDFLRADENSIETVASSERSVRGGSWAAASLTIHERASLPAASCSPFVGFRPVIALRTRKGRGSI